MDVRRDAGRMNETECEVREVTVPWMNVRIGRCEADSPRLTSDEVDEEGVNGGVGIVFVILADVGVDPEGLEEGSGGSSIFVYGMKAFGAWSGNIENRGKTYTSTGKSQACRYSVPCEIWLLGLTIHV